MSERKSHYARILEHLQQAIAKQPTYGVLFTPGMPGTSSGQTWQMKIINDTNLTLKLGQYYGVEVDYSLNPIARGQSAVATIVASWGPPFGFYMIFADAQNPGVWGGLLGLVNEAGRMQIVQEISGPGIVNHVSADLSTDKLQST